MCGTKEEAQILQDVGRAPDVRLCRDKKLGVAGGVAQHGVLAVHHHAHLRAGAARPRVQPAACSPPLTLRPPGGYGQGRGRATWRARRPTSQPRSWVPSSWTCL